MGVLATDRTLTKAQCQKLAGIGHDGLARALDPVHTMFDGDTVFVLATCEPDRHPTCRRSTQLLVAAGDCLTRAVVHGVLAATTTDTPDGPIRSYRDASRGAHPLTPPTPTDVGNLMRV